MNIKLKKEISGNMSRRSLYSIVTVIFFMAFCIPADAEIVYLKLEGESVEIGRYNSKNRKIDREDFDISNKQGIITGLSISECSKVLYYFHCYLGNFRPYHNNSIKHLREIEGYDKIVCLEWNPKKIGYKNSWEYAYHQGVMIGEIMDELLSSNSNSVLCHSMGNRFFEGVASKFGAKVLVDKLILAAADLSMSCFENGNALNNFECQEIIILANRRDHMLKLSKITHGEYRLGLNVDTAGVFPEYCFLNKVQIWDVTDEVRAGRIGSHHAYFKRTDQVFTELKSKLEE